VSVRILTPAAALSAAPARVRRLPYRITRPLFACLCAAALCFQGCADKSLLRFQKIADAAGRDEYAKAAAEVVRNKKLYGSDNALLYHMDLGLLYHYAGRYDSSIAELSQAVAVHEGLFAKSVSNEAFAFVTNDNSRPYRGKPHEIVLLHQFLAFDYLALGKFDDAVVEARQTQLYLDELKRKAGPAAKGYVDDGMFRYLSALAYQAAGAKDDAAISMYQSVKAYRNGPVTLPTSVARGAFALLKAQDRENDIQELKLEGTPPPQAGGAIAPADAGGAEIIVVGEAGRAPALDQSVYWGTYARDGLLVLHYHDANGHEVTQALPAPGLPASELEKASRGRRTRSGTTFHVKFALPEVKDVKSATSFFSVAGEAAPGPVKTEPLTDLRPLMDRYLEENHGAMLTRTVVRVVLRTIAAQETKDALSGGNPIINLIFNVGTDVLADQLEQADTRTCFLLPRTVQIARIPVKPGIHSLTVEAHDANGNPLAAHAFDDVEVKAGEKKFLFFASLK